MDIQNTDILVEIETEMNELRKLGLSEEEIEGYIEFYLDTFFPTKFFIREEIN